MKSQFLTKLILSAIIPCLVTGSVFSYRLLLGHYWQIGSPAAYAVLFKSAAIVDVAQSLKQQTAINPFLLLMMIVLRITHFLLEQGLHISDSLVVYTMLRPEVYLTVMHATLLVGLALILWRGGWLLAQRQIPWWQISLLQGSVLFTNLGLHESLMPTTQLLTVMVGYLLLFMVLPQLVVNSANENNSQQLKLFLDQKPFFTGQWTPFALIMAGLMLVGLSLQSWWASLLWWPLATCKTNRDKVQYALALLVIPELIGYLNHYYQLQSLLSGSWFLNWGAMLTSTNLVFLINWAVISILLALATVFSQTKPIRSTSTMLFVGWIVTGLWTIFLQMLNPTQPFWIGPSLLLPTISGWIISNNRFANQWLSKVAIVFLVAQLSYVGWSGVTAVRSSQVALSPKQESNSEIVDRSLTFAEVTQQAEQYSPRLRHLIYGLSFTPDSVQSTFFALYGK